MSAMPEIVPFLLARIAEDEALASETLAVGRHRYGDRYHDEVHYAEGGLTVDDGWLVLSPYRLFAECAAKRGVIWDVMVKYADWSVLVQLSKPYSWHPDYRSEWRP